MSAVHVVSSLWAVGYPFGYDWQLVHVGVLRSALALLYLSIYFIHLRGRGVVKGEGCG